MIGAFLYTVSMGKRVIADFRELVWEHYRQHARSMPWREDPSPYKVVVSEVMLQQTQVDRVTPKFLDWVKQWPSFADLAAAPTDELLRVWKGLGYNRRALRLRELARIVAEDHAGRLPDSQAELEALPGIGPHTAGAILAYAFNRPVVFIETNIRRVFLHHFFADQDMVHDRELLAYIEAALDREHPREWYWALMDYGSWLKSQIVNPNRRSRHHVRQAKFEGSNRQLRGKILDLVLQQPQTIVTIVETCPHFSQEQVEKALIALESEGFLSRDGARYTMKS